MNNKMLGVFAGLFLMVMLIGVASAALTISNVPSLSQDEDYFLFTIESDINDSVSVSVSPIVDETQTIEFEPTNNIELVNGTPQVVRVNYSSEDFDFEFGEEYSTDMTITGNNDSVVREISFESHNYCGTIPNEGELSVSIEDVEVVEGFGDDEDFWYLYDEIRMEVEVENRGDFDLEDVELEWVLYAGDVEIMSDDVSREDVDEGDDEVYYVDFKLDEDIEEFRGEDAYVYIRAVGEIYDRDSELDGDLSCGYTSDNFEVVTRDRFVILNEFELNGINLEEMVYDEQVFSCGDSVSINADVLNIGDRDEDDVYVQFYNSELGLNEVVDIGDIDAFDEDSVYFEFEIPEDVEDGWDNILIEVYDEDKDLYENDEDDESSYSLSIKTESCYVEPPQVSAQLDSEAKAGETIVVLASVTNIDDEELGFTFNANNYSDWASLESLEPRIATVDAQGSQEVRIELMVDKDAEGIQNFELEVLSDGEIVASQPISVTLEESQFNFLDFVSDNKKTIGIVLLNLILLILIIVIAVKILRRR